MSDESMTFQELPEMDESSAFRLMNSLLLNSSDETKAAFLAALHSRGETGAELSGFVRALRNTATLGKIHNVMDIVGTGGDGKNTINVSTAASFVVSSLGIRVAKHGNYGATSNKGSGDFLRFLGYNFEMDQEELARRVNDTNFAFILAPLYNAKFAKFAKARKSLPHKTVFNYLGPITNPADPENLVLGVTHEEISRLYSNFMIKNDKRGYIIYSRDGMDEISPETPSMMTIIKGSESEKIEIHPEDIIGDKIRIDEVSATEPADSFRMTLEGISGKRRNVSRFIALNAAPALVLNGKAGEILDAYDIAMEAISSGTVSDHLDKIMGDCRR
ncbi:MAG: anthranilate phosphoribosyltransferase [Candidatus Thermoplasmatota archaeon]|nr:anthranilate phosphoribosyltransferase [Candidatus Thermoplasmatota archaeon]